jgi:hypothetical protein
MKTNESIRELENKKEVIWESKAQYYINNEATDHATWLNSILSGPRTAYEILETEKTGKNVLDVKNKESLNQVKFKVRENLIENTFCLKCRTEINIGSEIFLCSTCGCSYCEKCASEVLYFRTKKPEEGTYCSNCF